MKSIQQLKKLRNEAIALGLAARSDNETAVEQRHTRAVLRYNWAIKYLERGATPAFVRSEIVRMETLISSLMARFKPNEKISQKMENEFRRKHEEQYKIPAMRVELTNLRFLNSDSDD